MIVPLDGTVDTALWRDAALLCQKTKLPVIRHMASRAPVCISNHRPIKTWDEITYPFSNFDSCMVKIWECITNFIQHFIMDVIAYPCWDRSKSMLVKGFQGDDLIPLDDLCLALTHWGRDKMDAISQTTFSYAISSMKIVVFWLNFHWNMFARVQLTIMQHWFR